MCGGVLVEPPAHRRALCDFCEPYCSAQPVELHKTDCEVNVNAAATRRLNGAAPCCASKGGTASRAGQHSLGTAVQHTSIQLFAMSLQSMVPLFSWRASSESMALPRGALGGLRDAHVRHGPYKA